MKFFTKTRNGTRIVLIEIENGFVYDTNYIRK